MSIRSSVVTLIAELPDAYGVYDTPAPSARTVPCEVASVTRNEAYAALSQGLHPQWVLTLSDYAEYQDEHTCAFEGKEYRIIRTYTRPDYGIELTIERVTNHDL